ncbi:hypothetical protein EDD85DRAFT_789599 [Armillaria nabsnona]|nr:hypothetical protein EDD85DRAFT_789599 [Armillaria nabsnona]
MSPPTITITNTLPSVSDTKALASAHKHADPSAQHFSSSPFAFSSTAPSLYLASSQQRAFTPIDFFSSSRIAPHPLIASESASNPPLGRVFILIEIDRVERFNVEVYAGSGGFVTVNDVLARLQNVLRERLEPGVTGGCYKERCGCGCEALVDRRSGFTTMFDGLSVRSNGDQNKWRMHLRRHWDNCKLNKDLHIEMAPASPTFHGDDWIVDTQRTTRSLDRHCETATHRTVEEHKRRRLGAPWGRDFEYVTRNRDETEVYGHYSSPFEPFPQCSELVTRSKTKSETCRPDLTVFIKKRSIPSLPLRPIALSASCDTTGTPICLDVSEWFLRRTQQQIGVGFIAWGSKRRRFITKKVE